MIKPRDFATRHRRPLLWTAGVLCVYALLGFLFVPWLAERKLIETLQQRLGATATIDSIRFNPFTFAASIDLLDVQAADDTPLLSLQRLYLNADPLRLLLLKIRISEIVVDTLQLHYNRYSESDDTIARLVQQWNATAEPRSEEEPAAPENTEDPAIEDDELVRLQIGRVQYLNGSIHYSDAVPETDFSTTLGPLNIDIADVSTLDSEDPGRKDLVLQIEQEATLTWNSNFSIAPLQAAGHLALDNFSLTTPYRYFQDSLPFMLREGRVAIELDYAFSLNDAGPQIELNNIGVQVSELDAVENDSDTAFLQSGTVVVEDGSFLYPDMQANVAALRIDGLNVGLLQDAEGELNLTRMLSSFASDEPPDDDTGTPLQLTLDEFTLANTSVSFTDAAPRTPATFTINAQAGLQNFTLAPDMAMPFNIDLQFDSGGTLATRGTVQLFPALDVDATLELTRLSLRPLQPYIDEIAQLTLESGDLGFTAQLRSNSDDTLAWKGDLTLENLQVLDQQRAEQLFGLTALRAGDIDFSLGNKRLATSELVIDAPYARVFIDENGVSNIREAFKPAASADGAAESPEAEPAEQETDDDETDSLAISLGRMQLNGGSSDFTDRSLPIVFDTQMRELSGALSDFSSTSSQAMAVMLEGQVDEFGLVEITGALDPLNVTQQTEITLAFTNLDLASMTPYVIKFAGREIAQGKADVVLTYAIDDSALQANNSVVISDMRLGPSVEYPGAADLPLDLAVALLKNSEGIIDLDVPVTGDVNDPQFQLGPVIRQAVFNAIVAIVTSPFRLLSGLIGGGEDEIDDIRFRPGRSDLAPPEQETLQKLSSALMQRPQLVLVVPAPMDTETDTLALQTSNVDARVEAQLALDESEAQLPERRLAVLEEMYEMAMLTPALEELRMQFTSPVVAADGDDDEDTEPVLDVPAYNNALRERLITAEPVTEAMLQDLAHARQAAISTYFTMGGAITAERLRNQDVDNASVEDGWIQAGFDVDVME